MNNIDPTNVSSSDLAVVLGVTRDAVSKLYATGVIRQNGVARGKYDLFDAVPAYLDHLRSNKGSDVGARLKLAQERKLRLENDRAENDLVKTSDAAEIYRQACITFRSGATAIPKRLATKLSNATDPVVCRELLANEFSALSIEYEKMFRDFFGDAWDAPAAGR